MAPTPNTQLGIHLLETITLGMYNQPLHCVREYIQNAFDSIRNARRSHFLAREDGQVDIIVDTHSKTLSIRDDGTGLSPEEAVVHLVDIGRSYKASTDDGVSVNAGFRGIGRMAGISYCDRLAFETSNGSGKACSVTFDAAGINRLTRPGQPPTAIVSAINDNCQVDERPTDSDAKFMEVRLEGVRNPTLLDVEALAIYLEQTAPVRHDPTSWRFQNIIHSLAVEAGHPEALEAISVRICSPDGAVLRQIYRPFKDTFVTKDGRSKSRRKIVVQDIQRIPRNGEYRSWWGWIAQHERRGALADVPFRGLQVRMHNIAIGDHTLIQKLWTTKPHAVWCFGEIHIVDPALVPNAQRDDFEPCDALSRIQEELRSEVKQLERDIRNESTQRNRSVDNVIKRVEKLTSDVSERLTAGLTSYNEKNDLIEKLDKEAVKVENATKQRKRTEDEILRLRDSLRSVTDIREQVNKVRRTEETDALSHLDKKTRNAVRKVLAVVKEELSDEKKFAIIEQRAMAALRPGKSNR